MRTSIIILGLFTLVNIAHASDVSDAIDRQTDAIQEQTDILIATQVAPTQATEAPAQDDSAALEAECNARKARYTSSCKGPWGQYRQACLDSKRIINQFCEGDL